MNLIEKQTLNLARYGQTNPGLFKRLSTSLFGNNLFLSSQGDNFWTAIYSYQKASKKDLVFKGYSQNAIVKACVDTISSVAAQAPWAIYKVKSAASYNKLKSIQTQPYSAKQQIALNIAKEDALEPISGHYLNSVLQHPNEQQSGSEYMQNLLAMKLITGDSYEYANMADSKKIGELWVLPSQNIDILTDEYGSWPMRERGYKMFFGSREIKFTAEEVCHSKYWSPCYDGSGSHLYGMSPIDAAWVNILQDNTAREAAVEMLKNRGVRGVFMWENQNLTDENAFKATQDKIKEEWNQGNKEYRDKIIPIYGKGQWQNIGLSVKDLAILEICGMSKKEICNAYGVSEILFNGGDNAKYDNYIQARKELITRTVLPLLGTIRDARNRKLKGDWSAGGEKIVCDFDQTIYTELFDDVWDMVLKMKDVGVYSDNEMRIASNYEKADYPHAEEPWKKKDMIPVSLVDKVLLTQNNKPNGPASAN